MTINEIVVIATTFLGTLTVFVAAIKKLIKSANEVWEEINKLKQGVLSANAALTLISQQSPEASISYVKPDPALVFRWAQEHRAQNPYDLGPKNWERCLYDLGYLGGRANELRFEANGSLAYQ